jgi:hypothetical protein
MSNQELQNKELTTEESAKKRRRLLRDQKSI